MRIKHLASGLPAAAPGNEKKILRKMRHDRCVKDGLSYFLLFVELESFTRSSATRKKVSWELKGGQNGPLSSVCLPWQQTNSPVEIGYMYPSMYHDHKLAWSSNKYHDPKKASAALLNGCRSPDSNWKIDSSIRRAASVNEKLLMLLVSNPCGKTNPYKNNACCSIHLARRWA